MAKSNSGNGQTDSVATERAKWEAWLKSYVTPGEGELQSERFRVASNTVLKSYGTFRFVPKIVSEDISFEARAELAYLSAPVPTGDEDATDLVDAIMRVNADRSTDRRRFGYPEAARAVAEAICIEKNAATSEANVLHVMALMESQGDPTTIANIDRRVSRELMRQASEKRSRRGAPKAEASPTLPEGFSLT